MLLTADARASQAPSYCIGNKEGASCCTQTFRRNDKSSGLQTPKKVAYHDGNEHERRDARLLPDHRQVRGDRRHLLHPHHRGRQGGDRLEGPALPGHPRHAGSRAGRAAPRARPLHRPPEPVGARGELAGGLRHRHACPRLQAHERARRREGRRLASSSSPAPTSARRRRTSASSSRPRARRRRSRPSSAAPRAPPRRPPRNRRRRTAVRPRPSSPPNAREGRRPGWLRTSARSMPAQKGSTDP